MGYLVLQAEENRELVVIDGQQRLSTISFIILASLKVLKELEEKGIEPEDNKQRRELLYNNFIGFVDPKTLLSENKLKLNRHNDAFYRHTMVRLSEFPRRGLNASEKLMKDCFLFFHEKISQEYGSSGVSVIDFVDMVVDKLFFTVVRVDDEANAYKVFETLNARGVQLSSTDLLKNYLFSVIDKDGVHEASLEEAERLWEHLIVRLGDSKLPKFVRSSWNSRNPLARDKELFKRVKESIQNQTDAFAFIQLLREDIDIYIALQDPEDEFWKDGQYREAKEYIREMRLYRAKQHIPLMMRVYNQCSFGFFLKILRWCSVIIFRYNVIRGENPNELERVYNNASLKVEGDESLTERDFRKVYIDDETFEYDFAQKSFGKQSHDIAKFVLSKIEKQNYQCPMDHDALTIEHILPQNPNENGWAYFSDEEVEKYSERLGNLALLEKNLNKDAQNKAFMEKKYIYEKSSVQSVTKLCEEETWGPDNIVRRQKHMARVAKTIWRIP